MFAQFFLLWELFLCKILEAPEDIFAKNHKNSQKVYLNSKMISSQARLTSTSSSSSYHKSNRSQSHHQMQARKSAAQLAAQRRKASAGADTVHSVNQELSSTTYTIDAHSTTAHDQDDTTARDKLFGSSLARKFSRNLTSKIMNAVKSLNSFDGKFEIFFFIFSQLLVPSPNSEIHALAQVLGI